MILHYDISHVVILYGTGWVLTNVFILFGMLLPSVLGPYEIYLVHRHSARNSRGGFVGLSSDQFVICLVSQSIVRFVCWSFGWLGNKSFLGCS